MSVRRFVRALAPRGLVLLWALACHHGAPAGADSEAPPPTPGWGRPRSGLEVIGWMRRVHPSRELRTLTFALRVATAAGDSTVALARGYARLPGRFRLNLLPARSRSGYVRDRQRLSVFERGRRVERASHVDVAMLVAFDVFAQSIDTTIMWLDSSAVRFGLLRQDELDGRRVWVVGAAEGDTTNSQFWVDADRWRVLRVIQRDARPPHALVDIRFTEFGEYFGVPVPVRVEVRRNGRVERVLTLSELELNPRISARAFDLARWRDVRTGGGF